ncbi:MAG: hypothetical protein A07HR60_01736 [uncultured archaeon A07HR60]|nr:MAG: hypothetical protein A07HR60_01736 [uncultured archaeon A07HR60]
MRRSSVPAVQTPCDGDVGSPRIQEYYRWFQRHLIGVVRFSKTSSASTTGAVACGGSLDSVRLVGPVGTPWYLNASLPVLCGRSRHPESKFCRRLVVSCSATSCRCVLEEKERARGTLMWRDSAILIVDSSRLTRIVRYEKRAGLRRHATLIQSSPGDAVRSGPVSSETVPEFSARSRSIRSGIGGCE